MCKWVTRATGRNRGLAAALESSYSFSGIFATVNCRVVVVPCGASGAWGWDRGRDRDALGAWSGVARSGELLIRFHFLPFPSIPTVDGGNGAGYEDPPPQGRRASVNQDSNQLGYDVRGSCRWFGELSGLTLNAARLAIALQTEQRSAPARVRMNEQ